MAFAVHNHLITGSVLGAFVQSATFDSSNIDGLLVAVGTINGHPPYEIYDNKFNAFGDPVATLTVTDVSGRVDLWLYVIKNPRVGTGHYVFVQTAGGFPTVMILGTSGCNLDDLVDQLVEIEGTGTTQAVNFGSGITPTVPNSIVVAIGTAYSSAAAPTITSGYTTQALQGITTGYNTGGIISYQIQTTATPRNPTITYGQTGERTQLILNLKPATASNTIRLTCPESDCIRNVDFNSVQHNEPLAIKFTGTTPTTIQYQACLQDDSVAVDWTNIASPSIGSGVASGLANLLVGDGYKLRVRSLDGSSNVLATSIFTNGKIGVGDLSITGGQSNQVRWGDDDEHADEPHESARVFDGVRWRLAAGIGDVAYCNDMIAAQGIPCGMILCARAGSAVTADPGNGAGFWLDDTAGSPWDTAKTRITAAGGKARRVIATNGEADAFIGATREDFYEGMVELYGKFRTFAGLSRDQLKFGVPLLGNIDDDQVTTDAACDAIRFAQADFIANEDGAFSMGSQIDLQRADADPYHTITTEYAIRARRASNGALHLLSFRDSSSIGPVVTEWTRESGSADLYGTVQHEGGTAITPTTGITGFKVAIDDVETEPESVTIQSGRIRVRMAAKMLDSESVEVSYQLGSNPDVSGALHDDYSEPLALGPIDWVEVGLVAGTKQLTFVVCQAGALIEADSTPTLSSPTATYGVNRLDTGETVVADGTEFSLAGDTLYSKSFTEPAVDLTYRYYVEAIVGAVTFHLPRTTAYVTSAMLAIGRYTNSHEIEKAFGVENVHKWLAIDESDEAADYALRAYRFIADAEDEIDNLLRGGPSTVPFTAPIPAVISKIATNLAAVRMYEARGVVDMNEDTGQVQHRLRFSKKDAETQISRIKSGQLRFSVDAAKRYPVVMSDGRKSDRPCLYVHPECE